MYPSSVKLFYMMTLWSLIVIGCSESVKQHPDVGYTISEQASEWITAYTSGKISKYEPIELLFAEPADTNLKSPVQLEPATSYAIRWTDTYHAKLYPTDHWTSGTTYRLSWKLDKLLPSTEAPEEVTYLVDIISADFEYTVDQPRFATNSSDQMSSQLIIRTSDLEQSSLVEKMVQIDDQNVVTTWNHQGRLHLLDIQQIQRREEAYELSIVIDGHPIGQKRSEQTTLQIPGKGAFTVLSIHSDATLGNRVSVTFSDPLDPKQNLQGLITLGNERDFDFSIQTNTIDVFLSGTIDGERLLTIFPGIKSYEGKALKNRTEETITFAHQKPAARLLKSGNLLPTSNESSLGFETMNLRAVDVSIKQIFEDNIPYFLQTNSWDATGSLNQVGRLIQKKTIELPLDLSRDLNQWQQHFLDLSQYVEVEPGAIYQVDVSFRQSMSVFPCSDTDSLPDIESLEWQQDDWKDFNQYDDYWYYPTSYDWRERDNPCHPSFFTRDRHVTSNILITDLGLVAKLGKDKRLHIVTTNLVSGKPQSGVDIQVLDYQLQSLVTTTTDQSGFVQIAPGRRPYLVIASNGQQHAYLKLEDGLSLSMSQFDVGGQEVIDGQKVFIYGERGVWRPGDTMHISCMIDDQDLPLPTDYPIEFTLTDPRGNKIDQQIQIKSNRGIYVFETHTSPEAPTGNYLAKIVLGPNVYTKKLKVETIKPNRLKVDWSSGDELISATKRTHTGSLSVQWLTGATARNSKVTYDYDLSILSNPFDGYTQYAFIDRTKSLQFERTRAFEMSTDTDGKASFKIPNPSLNSPPGILQMQLFGKIYEPGGDFSIDYQTRTYSPYPSYVGSSFPNKTNGYYYPNGQAIQVQLANLTETGDPIPSNNLTYELYKIDWRWWWDRSNRRANLIRAENQAITDQGEVSVNNGRSSLTIQPNEGGRYYLQVCDNQSGHCSGQVFYVDWRSEEGLATAALGANYLDVSSAQDEYEVGEMVTMRIPSNTEASALVTIENGSGLVEQEWIDLQDEMTEYTFQASRAMSPNAYVSVLLIQPHAQTINDLPLRLYGVKPIQVKDANSRLVPQISAPTSIRPNDSYELNISEESGRKMEYTLAVVDEGLLDITQFATPDPYRFFNAKDAIGVKTWDLYDQVIGAYGVRAEKLLAIGGDGSAGQATDRKANRFKPVVDFIGPFELDAKATQKHTLKMDHYVGSVRVMVVAATKNAHGEASTTMKVTQPLMVLGTLPRVLGPNEKSTFPIQAFVLDDDIKEVTVEVVTKGAIEVLGDTKKTLNFDDIGDQIMDFEIQAKSLLGVGSATVIARSGREEAKYEVEMDVRAANPSLARSTSKILESGESGQLSIAPFGIAGTIQSTLELSTIPALNLDKRLGDLIGYPHGCVEQTTSKAFPQLYLEGVTELSLAQKDQVQKHITAAIKKLYGYQTIEGGFSYWPGGSPDYWSTNYVGHFLVEAQNRGYAVSPAVLQRWTQYQKNLAGIWRTQKRSTTSEIRNENRSQYIQGYRLYTLALAGQAQPGVMNRFRETKDLYFMAQWLLAGTYALIEEPSASEQIIQSIHASGSASHRPILYGSTWRDEALAAQTLINMGRESDAYKKIVSLATELGSGKWMSTHTTAFVLKAIGMFMDNYTISSNISATITYADGTEKNISTQSAFHQEIIAEEALSEVQVANKGEGALFAHLVRRAVPISGEESIANQGLRLDVKYLNSDKTVSESAQFVQGEELTIVIDVDNISTQNIDHIALSQILPSGWEIRNDRLQDPRDAKRSAYDYQDIRDDRIYTYFDLARGQKKSFTFYVTNTYAGRYYKPAVSVEAMYDGDVFAHNQGQWITINRS